MTRARTQPPVLVTTRAELDVLLGAPQAERAVVMTMGALHDGHLALVRRARSVAEQVVVTIFVNPLQFGPGEDLERYPRQLEADLALLATAGADVVFAPSPNEVYPDGDPQVRICAGKLGAVLEGAERPGHFDGVLTVVLKLLHLTRPGRAVFGQKDAQQLALVRRMVHDLDLPVEVVAVPTVREPDGLALSSRNAYLTAGQRQEALVIYRSLREAAAAAAAGSASDVLDAARSTLAQVPTVVPDYVTLVRPETLEPVAPDWSGPALLLVAARVGRTRLIDNLPVQLRAAAPPGHVQGP